VTWQFDIENVRRVGPIEIGANRQSVHEVLGPHCKPFRRTPDVKEPSDYYEAEGIFVYYRAGGLVEAIELTSPSQANVAGKNLLSMTLEEGQSELKDLDEDVVLESDGAISERLGIAIYASGGAGSMIDSTIVFERGYYDQ
jgi:hypothetical protein